MAPNRGPPTVAGSSFCYHCPCGLPVVETSSLRFVCCHGDAAGLDEDMALNGHRRVRPWTGSCLHVCRSLVLGFPGRTVPFELTGLLRDPHSNDSFPFAVGLGLLVHFTTDSAVRQCFSKLSVVFGLGVLVACLYGHLRRAELCPGRARVCRTSDAEKAQAALPRTGLVRVPDGLGLNFPCWSSCLPRRCRQTRQALKALRGKGTCAET